MSKYGDCCVGLFLLPAWFLGLFLLESCSSSAQIAVSSAPIADCQDVALEATPHIYRAPGDVQVIAIDYRNTTARPCILHPYTAPVAEPHLVLNPGAIAHTSFRWSFKPPSPGSVCRDVLFRTLNANRSFNSIERYPNGLLLNSRLILPPLCSEVEGSPVYLSGPFVPDWPSSGSVAPLHSPSLTLTLQEPSYYGEQLMLHLAIDHLTSDLPLSKYGCPILFRALRNISGFTQIDEITPSHHVPCLPEKEQVGSAKFSGAFDVSAFAGSSSAERGDKTFRYLEFLGYSAQGELLFAESNSITLKPEEAPDPATLIRRWGPVKDGVRVGLTLDKLNYQLGEDVPLHIAAEVLSATQAVFAERFGRTGAFNIALVSGFRLMIGGEDGPLPGSERNGNLRYFSLGGSSGPSVCPPPLTPGKVLPLERSLKHVGLLPDRPGTYKIIVSWSPYTTRYSSCEAVPAWNAPDPKEEPFTTVFSTPLEIEIAGPAASENAPQTPEYTAWKRSFTLTKTSFGDQTALLDNVTHLAWLRLNLSADLSYDQVTKQMSEGGRFSGWRYATANELSTLFKHFIGGPDTTTDPSIEDKFQRLLGGPLKVDGNPATGWYRTSSSAIVEDHSALGRELRGYIANDRSTGAVITPKVEGYTSDKYASYGASWLVQQR